MTISDINASPGGYIEYPYSFTGPDFRVTYVSRNNNGLTRVMSNLQTLSFSTHSELYPGRRLGERAAHGYARGPRTSAGSFIFLFLGNDPFLEELAVSQEIVKANGAYESRRCHIEMIPEFDMIIEATSEVPIKFNNQIINATKMFIGGVSLAETGGTISVHDMYTEITYTWVSRYLVPFASTIPPAVLRRLTQPQSPPPKSIGALLNQHADILKQFEKTTGRLLRQ